MKCCTRCKIEKPLSEFYIARSSRDGFQARCKPCQKQLVREWQKANPDRVREGVQRARANNPDLYRELDRQRHIRDRSKRLAAMAAYDRSHQEAIKERRATERSRLRAIDPGFHGKRTREWREKYPERAKLQSQSDTARRRARKRQVPGSHTAKERHDLLQSYLGLCVYCHAPVAATNLDHIVPIVLGGCNHINNLTPACERCNKSKGKLSLLQFLIKRSSAR